MTPPGAPQDPVEVVLSAESADVGVHRVPRERVRMRREVVTEEVTVVVPVRREVLRVESEPVAGAGQPAPAAEPFEVVLSEERPVVGLEVVPYERVRVDVRAVPTATEVEVAEAREVVDVATTPLDPRAR